MSRPVCVGFLGRLSKQKNAAMLLDAFSRAFAGEDDCTTLAIAGSGPDEENLRRRCAELGLGQRVKWLGHCDAAVMSSFDIFALPSSYEGMPYVLLEAMRARLPIVATAVGGVRSVIANGEQGLIVEPGDCRAFASALHALASNASLRQRMAQSAAERVAQFTLSRMVNETVAVYRSVAHENIPNPRRLTAAEVP